MRASIENATGLLIEAGDSTVATLIANALAQGYSREAFTVREVTRAELQALLAAVNGPAPLPLELIQTRLEAEQVGATTAWEVYCNFMFGTNARRNAFLKTIFLGRSINPSNNAVRTSLLNSLTGAGLTAATAAAIVDRIFAPANGG